MFHNFASVTNTRKTSSKEKVIVIGCSVPGYAVIRALAHKNIDLIAMTYAMGDVAQMSHYVSEVAHCPVPEADESRFIAFLMEHADRWQGALILETSDSTSIVLSKNKDILSKRYRIVAPDWQTLHLFVEKEKTYALAKECKVPFPRSVQLSRWDDIKEISEIQYPCILKPVRSFEFVTKFQKKNFQVNSEDELVEKYKLCLDTRIPVIVQEIIPGPDENLFKLQGYINSRGQMVGKFFHKKLRQNPPHFGVMRVGVSTEKHSEVEELTERLLFHIGYRGYFSIEFKKDPRDNQLKLMENNCRMPRSGLLAIASGVNFPWLIYQDLVLDQQCDITEYKVGTYWIDLLPDISNTLYHHNQEDISLREYIRPYLVGDKVFADLDFRDLKPFLRFASKKIQNLRRKYLDDSQTTAGGRDE